MTRPSAVPAAVRTARLPGARRLAAVLLSLLAAACGGEPAPTPAAPPFRPAPADVERHNKALALMGRFEFEDAVPAFEAVLAAAPAWDDARVNLAIALLNTQEEPALDRAQAELGTVLERQPGHLRAATSSGLIHLYRGQAAQALPLLQSVAQADPDDAYAMSWVGSALKALDRHDEAVAWFTRAFTREPYLQSAYYEAFQSLLALDRAAEGDALLEAYQRLAGNPLARLAQFKYSRMGRKAMAVAGDAPRAADVPGRPAGTFLGEPTALALGGAALGEEAGAPVAADLDGDGLLDLFVPAGRSPPQGARGRVLRGTAAGFEPVPGHPLGRVEGVRTALLGDLDNDGRVDAYLLRAGSNVLLMQGRDGGFSDVTERSGAGGGGGTSVDGLLADLDHDGDLDIYLVKSDAPAELLSNNLDGTFRALGASIGVGGDGRPGVGVVAADLDLDRDLDLVLVKAQPPHQLWWNDRLWSWTPEPAQGTAAAFLASPAEALLAADADSNGHVELYAAWRGEVVRWALGPGRTFTRSVALPADAKGTPAAALAVADLDADMRLDLLALGADGGVRACTLGVSGAAEAYAAPAGTWGPPSLLVRDPARGPELAWNAGERGLLLRAPPPSRYQRLALALSGKHKDADEMRSNASGLGTRATVVVGERTCVHLVLRSHSGPGQGLQPVSAGLGPAGQADYVSLDWPDGLLQTEAGLAAGRLHRLEEVQRQTSSCPVLFCWDGERYRFVTDLLGVGGIGFWVAPGTYATPVPRENVLLPVGLPVARDGRFALKLGEPMEEACYLDQANLVAWDLPPGWQLVLDERMAIHGPPASGEARFFRTEVLPVRARDGSGADVTDSVRSEDQRAAPVGPRDHRFLGRTHGTTLVLEFDRDLEALPGQPLLVADGWVEYPYASIMFAAWQAGAEYRAPTLEARGADGAWTVVQEQFGYPAGMPRRMSFPLAGLPRGTRALRLTTTQEVYWDRLAVAGSEPCPEARRQVLPRRRAWLDEVGFARRTTGPQRLPHYDWERRLPLWDCRHQRGLYTRFGDVEALVDATDDALVVFGPGEEVHLEWEARLPAPAPGWTRRHVLETTGWCKDSDLATRDGDTVGPLPVRAGVTPSPARDALHAATLTRHGPLR